MLVFGFGGATVGCGGATVGCGGAAVGCGGAAADVGAAGAATDALFVVVEGATAAGALAGAEPPPDFGAASPS